MSFAISGSRSVRTSDWILIESAKLWKKTDLHSVCLQKVIRFLSSSSSCLRLVACFKTYPSPHDSGNCLDQCVHNRWRNDCNACILQSKSVHINWPGCFINYDLVALLSAFGREPCIQKGFVCGLWAVARESYTQSCVIYDCSCILLREFVRTVGTTTFEKP